MNIGTFFCSLGKACNACTCDEVIDIQPCGTIDIHTASSILLDKMEEIGAGNAEIYLPDENFKVYNKEDVKAFLKLDEIDKIPYVTESHDCITGDTPVWVKSNGVISLVEVRELLPYGSYARYAGLQILSREGFVDILSVAKKQTRKRIIRLADSSDIGITVDHKVVTNPNLLYGKYTPAGEVSSERLIKKLPSFGNDTKSADTELAWADGLFLAEGGAYLRGNNFCGAMWSIRCGQSDSLERAESAYTKSYPDMKFYIKEYPSEAIGVRTNLGIRKQGIKQLLCAPRERHNDGSRGKFIRRYRSRFYNTFGVKKIPSDTFKLNKDGAQSFWDGSYAGDGSKGGIVSSSKLETMGLSALLNKLGKTPLVTKDKSCSIIRPASEVGHYWGDRFMEVRKPQIKRYDHPVTEVFDVSTASGEFVAGDICIKNCDDFSAELFGLFAGLVWTNAHALNFFIDESETLWFVEPQSDEIAPDLEDWQGWRIRFFIGR